MKTSWSKAVRRKVQTVAEAIAVAARADLPPTHACDGFHCDCERRREIAAQQREDLGWLPARPDWLKRE